MGDDSPCVPRSSGGRGVDKDTGVEELERFGNTTTLGARYAYIVHCKYRRFGQVVVRLVLL